MSENPPFNSRSRLTSAPAVLPEHVIQNIPIIAKERGLPDISDGIRSIGDLLIRSPQEEEICSQSYIAPLLDAREKDLMLPSTLRRQLQIKIACGALRPREHAVMAFGFKNTAKLRHASMPLLKDNVRYAFDSLNFAADRQLLKSSEQRRKGGPRVSFCWGNTMAVKEPNGSYSQAVADLLKIDLSGISDPRQERLAPATVHRRYIERYGGLPMKEADPQALRDELKHRYEQDLEGRIFYLNPVSTLMRIFEGRYGPRAWHDVKTGYNPALPKEQQKAPWTLPVQCAGLGGFGFETEGLTAQAAHQAGARLILDHIGATNLDLLK